jgi:hypothetical protein
LRQGLAIVIGVVAAVFGQYYITQGMYAAAFGVAVAGGFAAGYVGTGTLKGGIQGAFAGGLSFGVGMAFQGANIYAQMFAQGISGGVVEGINGGDFGNGFLSAGLTTAFMPQLSGIRNDIARTAVGAIIGGSISKATGGKFANGAISGAIQGAMAKTSNPEDPSLRNRGKDVNSKLAESIRNRVNDAMQEAGKYDIGYTTAREAAESWWDTVSELKLQHEVGAGIFEQGGKYYVGRAISSGAKSIIYGAHKFIGSDKFTTFVHNHPSGAIRLSGDGLAYQLVEGKMVSVCSVNCTGDVSFAMNIRKDIYAFSSSGNSAFNYNQYMNALNASQGAPVSVMTAITTSGP